MPTCLKIQRISRKNSNVFNDVRKPNFLKIVYVSNHQMGLKCHNSSHRTLNEKNNVPVTTPPHNSPQSMKELIVNLVKEKRKPGEKNLN